MKTATPSGDDALAFVQVNPFERDGAAGSHADISVDDCASRKERRQIAQEIHDGVGHTLTSILWHVAAARRIGVHDGCEVAETLDTIEELARTGLREIHASVAGLPVHIGTDLRATLRNLLPAIQKHSGVIGTVDIVGDEKSLSSPIAGAIFGIAREAVCNALRHAHPSAINISLRIGHVVVLRVSDNGIGFDVGLSGNVGRHGVVGMRAKAGAVAGEFDIRSRPGLGTTVTFMAVHEVASPLQPAVCAA